VVERLNEILVCLFICSGDVIIENARFK
jgi:hypothetical protein